MAELPFHKFDFILYYRKGKSTRKKLLANMGDCAKKEAPRKGFLAFSPQNATVR